MTETTETKRRAFSIMLTEDERDRIEKAASQYGDSFSNYARTLLLQAAERYEYEHRGAK